MYVCMYISFDTLKNQEKSFETLKNVQLNLTRINAILEQSVE